MKTTCDGVSAVFVVAAIPARETIQQDAFEDSIGYIDIETTDFDLEKPYRNLRRFCDAESIPFCDPREAFRQGGEGLYLPHDMHFSAKGHRLFAEELAKTLRAVLSR